MDVISVESNARSTRLLCEFTSSSSDSKIQTPIPGWAEFLLLQKLNVIWLKTDRKTNFVFRKLLCIWRQYEIE